MPDYGAKIYYVVYKEDGDIEVPLFDTKEALDQTLKNLEPGVKDGRITIFKSGYEYLNADAI